MRTALGKVLVGYKVPDAPDVNAKVLEDTYFRLPKFAAHTPPSLCKGVWQMAVYYKKETRDQPERLRNEFQRALETKLDRVVQVSWFDVGPSSTPGGLTPAR